MLMLSWTASGPKRHIKLNMQARGGASALLNRSPVPSPGLTLENIMNTTIEAIKELWASRLPDDLTLGEFDEDFRSADWPTGAWYHYGAWNQAGEWVLCWNTHNEFLKQLADLNEPLNLFPV